MRVLSVRVVTPTLLVAAATAAHAQCKVDKTSNEAKLLAYYAAPLVFSPSGSLETMKAGSIRLGFEVTAIPAPADRLRHTSKCFTPKEENSQLSPIFPRPHVAVGLGAGLFIEGMYLPPVTVLDATPNMASVALGYARNLTAKLGVAVRGHATFGNVKGPITCNKEALQNSNPDAACYGTDQSKDTYKPNIVGADAAIIASLGPKISWYGGAGFASLKPRFTVGFQQLDGFYDHTLVVVDLTRFSLETGAAFLFRKALAVTAEVYSVPQDLTTVRIGGTWLLR